jgi:hypothetical protein
VTHPLRRSAAAGRRGVRSTGEMRDDVDEKTMPVGWAEGAARVCAVVEDTDAVPAALFTALRDRDAR